MEKTILLLILFWFIPISDYSQNSDWKLFSNENTTIIDISKTKIYKIDEFSFEVIWDNKLSYSENIGFYGGIKSLTIHKKDKKLQVINHIEDNIALGEIHFNFYDYNLDGYLDFTLPINSRWNMYFIFNPQTSEFEHREDWDYLKIQKINKINKQILSEQDGMRDNRKLYHIKGLQLIELK